VTSDISFTPRQGVGRRFGGALALFYPLMLMGFALSVGFRGSNDVSGLATAILGAILFLVAAPTTWVFAIDFIEASRFTVITAGALTSLPLWYLLGSRLAGGAENWLTWLKRYAIFCGLWTVMTFVLMVLLARVT
jgi:hypothetical protein